MNAMNNLFIYLVILSHYMEPQGYGLKMRKKARKENSNSGKGNLKTHKHVSKTNTQARLLPSLSPRPSAPRHYRSNLPRHIDLKKFVKNMTGALSPARLVKVMRKGNPASPV
jgi:hypothetical protein